MKLETSDVNLLQKLLVGMLVKKAMKGHVDLLGPGASSKSNPLLLPI